MASRLTSPARIAAALTAAVVAVALLAPACRMLSCDGGFTCGHPAPERSRFTSACGHEAPQPGDGGSCDDGTAMRHEDPAAPSAVRETVDTPFAVAVLPGGTDAGARAGIAGAPSAADEKPPTPPPDPLFGRLVI